MGLAGFPNTSAAPQQGQFHAGGLGAGAAGLAQQVQCDLLVLWCLHCHCLCGVVHTFFIGSAAVAAGVGLCFAFGSYVLSGALQQGQFHAGVLGAGAAGLAQQVRHVCCVSVSNLCLPFVMLGGNATTAVGAGVWSAAGVQPAAPQQGQLLFCRASSMLVGWGQAQQAWGSRCDTSVVIH
jgi:hypothetical protein